MTSHSRLLEGIRLRAPDLREVRELLSVVLRDRRLAPAVTAGEVVVVDVQAHIGGGRKTVRDLGPGETPRLTIPYRGFADRVEVDEIRVIV